MNDVITPAESDRRATVRFEDEFEGHIEKILGRYPDARSALLPVLWACQQRWGWLSPGLIRAVAERLRLSPAVVEGTASFYTMFHLKPPATYVIEICRSLSCHLCRSRQIYEHVRSRLGVGFGETTADRRFSLVEVQCQGLCDQAPMVRINDEKYFPKTPESMDEVLDGLS